MDGGESGSGCGGLTWMLIAACAVAQTNASMELMAALCSEPNSAFGLKQTPTVRAAAVA